jgi:hypothetical protein
MPANRPALQEGRQAPGALRSIFPPGKQMLPRHLTIAALLVAIASLGACDGRGRVPDLVTAAPALPPAPTSSIAAARPVVARPSALTVPTPAGVALARADGSRSPATSGVTPAGPSPGDAASTGRDVAVTAPGDSICAGLRGSDMDACIDAAARASAGPVATDEDADRAFRAAQARRDQALMDDEDRDTRLAQARDDARDRDAMDRDAMDRDAMDHDAMDRDAMDRDARDRDARDRFASAPVDDGYRGAVDDEPPAEPLDDDGPADAPLDDGGPYPPPPDDYPRR